MLLYYFLGCIVLAPIGMLIGLLCVLPFALVGMGVESIHRHIK